LDRSRTGFGRRSVRNPILPRRSRSREAEDTCGPGTEPIGPRPERSIFGTAKDTHYFKFFKKRAAVSRSARRFLRRTVANGGGTVRRPVLSELPGAEWFFGGGRPWRRPANKYGRTWRPVRAPKKTFYS